MDCSTIIVSYNTYAYTRDAIQTALDAAPGLVHEVIVVDNASPDQSAARLGADFADDPRVHIVANPNNDGFSAANNLGVTQATGRVLFFLNSDTLSRGSVVTDLTRFVDETPDAGAVGPLVRNPDESVQVSTLAFGSLIGLVHHALPLWPRRKPKVAGGPRSVDVVKGCALAMSRRAFDAVGGWDASIFMYAEESELCRALIEHGYTNSFLPSTEIVHFGGQSTESEYVRHQLMERKNTRAFLRRYQPALVVPDRILGVLGYGARALAYSAAGRIRPSRAVQLRREASAAIFRWYLTKAS